MWMHALKDHRTNLLLTFTSMKIEQQVQSKEIAAIQSQDAK